MKLQTVGRKCPFCGRFTSNCDVYCGNCGRKVEIDTTQLEINKCQECEAQNGCIVFNTYVFRKSGGAK